MPEPFWLFTAVTTAGCRPDWRVYALLVLALVCAVTTREYARAWLADSLGDPSPGEEGRLRCSPRVQVSLAGLLLAVATALAGGGVPVGWGKPLALDPSTWRVDRRMGTLLIALAGPVGNLLAAVALSAAVRWLWHEFQRGPSPALGFVLLALFFQVWANLGLGLVHLTIPVTPLDGAKVAASLLPPPLGDAYARVMEKLGPLLLLILVVTGTLSEFVRPVLFGLLRLLIGAG